MKRILPSSTAPSRKAGRIPDRLLGERSRRRVITAPSPLPPGEDVRIVLQALESERRRIARELHDEFGQVLTGLKFDLAWLRKNLVQGPPYVEAGSLIRKTESIAASVDALMTTVRNTAIALRPPILDDLGLLPALEWLISDFQTRTGIRCLLQALPAMARFQATAESSTALFRMVQELLTNVRRHAKATAVRVRLHEQAGNLLLEVADNGTGILPGHINKPGALGIRGIQERAGLLGGAMTIIGEPEAGTTVRIIFPVRR
jgi:signal transduction histidine kinase